MLRTTPRLVLHTAGVELESFWNALQQSWQASGAPPPRVGECSPDFEAINH